MRQLAAILFADMTGYTALMQQNEELARQKRRRLKEVLEECVTTYNGKVLQYYGDGSLTIFGSAIDCIACSIRIQQQLQQEPRVEIRMGIHTGDVIIEDESIYGDGVNMASRIESLAVPGSIFISEKVFDEIKNQEQFSAREMGHFEFKNISQPVRIFAIANDGIVVPNRDELRGKTVQPRNRLAVLPFVNMSADPENEYFSDGITEELLNALTRVDGLQVTSRTSAFAFKGTNRDIRDIAIQLNVDKVLEGSVRKSGNRVRITSQLINAADGYHIWSETYDRNLTDIFDMQDEISSIIANKLRENLLPVQQEEKIVETPVQNVEAYTSYLKAMHFRNKLTPGDTRRCIDCCEKAIVIEPQYAKPWALAAEAYADLGAQGQMSPARAFEIVNKYADRSIELDNTIAEGYIAKACVYLYYDWNWKAAFEALQKAIELNPGATDAYEMLGTYYVVIGQKEKALEVLEKAVALDPLSPSILLALANCYIVNNRLDDAIVQTEKVLDMHPRMRAAMETKGWSFLLKNQPENALPLFEEVHRLVNHPLKGLMGLAITYFNLGRNDEGMACIEKLEQRAIEEPDAVVDADLAAAWHAAGNLDKSFYHLNRCVDQRMGPISYFLEFPTYRPLHNDPRYVALKKRLGLDSISQTPGD